MLYFFETSFGRPTRKKSCQVSRRRKTCQEFIDIYIESGDAYVDAGS